jgi:FtsZ-interacting cell division protein ZipA
MNTLLIIVGIIAVVLLLTGGFVQSLNFGSPHGLAVRQAPGNRMRPVDSSHSAASV